MMKQAARVSHWWWETGSWWVFRTLGGFTLFYIDQLRRCSWYRKGDEDIEGECDEDGGDEAEEEEEDEEVFDEVLLHKALLIHHLCPG